MENCIFCKIISGDLPSTLEYEDDKVIAFNDIHPQAKVHILVIPKEHIVDFNHLQDKDLLFSIKKALDVLIDKKLLMGKGYRIEVNGGGAQIVHHLHFHLMSPVAQPV
jgi:histidine triad (HIT) family protein